MRLLSLLPGLILLATQGAESLGNIPMSSSPSSACFPCEPPATASAGDGGFDVYRSGRSDHVDGRGDASQGYAAGKTTWTVVREAAAPTCQGNDRLSASALCPAAVTSCPAGQMRFWIWHQTVEYATVPGGSTTSRVTRPWRLEARSYCLAADDPGVPTIAKVVDRIQRGFAHLPLRRDGLRSDPGPVTLVNFDTAFSAGTAAKQSFDPVLLGTPVHVDATPTRWHWTWGDGTSEVTATPGVPNRPVLTHRYTHAADVTVTVVVEWRGTFRLPGDPTTYPITASALVRPQSMSLRVRTARSELVSR